MKQEISNITILERLQKLAPDMRGSFSTPSLFNLIGARSALGAQRAIKRLVNSGVLFRCQRGIYVTKNFDLWTVAARIDDETAYVSMESVLAKNGLIGTVVDGHVSVVTTKKYKRGCHVRDKRIDFYSIDQKLFFGFYNTRGILVADNEKAYLDLLYYYNRGHRFVIDPLNEVDCTQLNLSKINAYLKKYKNPKFVSFVKRKLYG